VCSSGEVKGKTGKCYEKGKEVNSSPLSYDRELQSKLWVKTNELLGISPDW